MHPCLYLDEIVRLIAHELIAAKREATAVALACCCKPLQDPVLDVLWDAHPHFFKLLKILPENIWSSAGYKVSITTKMLALPLTQLFDLKDFRKTSDDAGMGSIENVCSKDAES